MAVSSSSTTRITSLTPTTLRGGRAAARVVAGSRRPTSTRRPTSMVRASSSEEDKDADVKPIVTIAGKAVSAVVAAAVSLSSATHAAQAQVVVRAFRLSLSLSLSVVAFFIRFDEKDIVVQREIENRIAMMMMMISHRMDKRALVRKSTSPKNDRIKDDKKRDKHSARSPKSSFLNAAHFFTS